MSSTLRLEQYSQIFFKASLDEEDKVSAKNVSTVLTYLKKADISQKKTILKLYLKKIQIALSKQRMILEYAGKINPEFIHQLELFFSKHYQQNISFKTQNNSELISGFRAYINDDIWESSIANTLHSLLEN